MRAWSSQASRPNLAIVVVFFFFYSLLLAILATAPVSVSAVSNLTVVFPSATVSQFRNTYQYGAIPHGWALFGVSPYADDVNGFVVDAGIGKCMDGNLATWGCCDLDPDHPYNGFDLSTNPALVELTLPEARDPLTLKEPQIVMLIQRGDQAGRTNPCYFSKKIFNAQLIHRRVKAVIIYDGDPQQPYIFNMADDGFGRYITIPSMFVLNSVGSAMQTFTRPYPLTNPPSLRVSMDFWLPAPDDRVEWDQFGSVAEDESLRFRLQMGQVVDALGSAVLFRPHLISNGKGIWKAADRGCGGTSPPEWCKSLCVEIAGSGENTWCHTGPIETSAFYGAEGQAIVMETLRQYCYYDRLLRIGKPNSIFKYWKIFYQYDKSSKTGCTNAYLGDGTNRRIFNLDSWGNGGACSFRVIDSLAAETGVNSAMVRDCMAANPATNKFNGFFVNATNDLFVWSPYTYSAVMVNENPYYQDPFCATPIYKGTCGIVQMICEGFPVSARPSACLADDTCPFGQRQDSCGNCGGNNECLSSSSSSGSAGLTAGLVIFALLFAILLFANIVYFYLKYHDESRVDRVLNARLTDGGKADSLLKSQFV